MRRARILSLVLIAMLAWLAGAPPQPVAAQSNLDNVTFWDDAGNPGDNAMIVTPATAAADGYLYLNPNGGRSTSDGLLVIVGPGHYQVIRDRDWQIYDTGYNSGTMEWMVYADDACIGYMDCDEQGFVDEVYWTSTTKMLQNGPTTWKARMVNTAQHNGRTYTLTVDTTYTPPSQQVEHLASLKITPDYDGEVHLYLGADLLLDGSDYGPGYIGGIGDYAITAQINDTAAFGITAPGGFYSSLFEGYYSCPYTDTPSSCGIFDAGADNTGSDFWFGPGVGRPYPMPPIVNGASDGDDPNEDIDAGVGMHWNVSEVRTIQAGFWSSTRADFDDASKGDLPAPLPPSEWVIDDGSSEEESAVTPPAECELVPDMAITPEAISLAAGGRTTVTVTLRNLCNDRPLSNNDLLLSLSDGLRIVGGSEGLVNLGQRGAFQRFTLSAGETRSFVFEVEAASALTVAPLHVVELYRLGGVAKRIDGVFVGATVAAPPAVEAAPAPAPAPAEPAPILPVTLPNTAGEESMLLFVALLGLGAIGFGYRSLSRR